MEIFKINNILASKSNKYKSVFYVLIQAWLTSVIRILTDTGALFAKTIKLISILFKPEQRNNMTQFGFADEKDVEILAKIGLVSVDQARQIMRQKDQVRQRLEVNGKEKDHLRLRLDIVMPLIS